MPKKPLEEALNTAYKACKVYCEFTATTKNIHKTHVAKDR